MLDNQQLLNSERVPLLLIGDFATVKAKQFIPLGVLEVENQLSNFQLKIVYLNHTYMNIMLVFNVIGFYCECLFI